jgi:hypothetical protein
VASLSPVNRTLAVRPVQTDRTLVWPDGSIYRVTRSTADTGGELLEMEWELPAGGWAPQSHVHPGLTKEYEVLADSFEVCWETGGGR